MLTDPFKAMKVQICSTIYGMEWELTGCVEGLCGDRWGYSQDFPSKSVFIRSIVDFLSHEKGV